MMANCCLSGWKQEEMAEGYDTIIYSYTDSVLYILPFTPSLGSWGYKWPGVGVHSTLSGRSNPPIRIGIEYFVHSQISHPALMEFV